MKKYICFQCGDKDNYEIKTNIRKYKGFDNDDYCFELKVNTPFCKNCRASLKDYELDEKIRKIAHQMIVLSKEAAAL